MPTGLTLVYLLDNWQQASCLLFFFVVSPFSKVTVQTESERQIDKLRRKEEKRHKRGPDYVAETGLSAASFSSLLQASEKKNPFDDLVGTGEHLLPIRELPQGTIRKHHKGYEEVIIPPTPTAEMKLGEKLVSLSVPNYFCPYHMIG